MWIRGRIVAALLLAPLAAAAAPSSPPVTVGASDAGVGTATPPFVPALAAPPTPGVGLEGYTGIGLLVGAGDTRSRALVGGLLRIRYQYVQIGGSIETTDHGQSDLLETEEAWRTYQGFAGVVLPFERWIDVDASIGYAVRRFSNPDPIYGPSGLDVGGPAIAWRFGISDRFGERRFGARLGAALVSTIDLQSISAPYERRYLLVGGGIGATRGTTDLGGVSLALVVSGGLELGGRAVFRPHD